MYSMYAALLPPARGRAARSRRAHCARHRRARRDRERVLPTAAARAAPQSGARDFRSAVHAALTPRSMPTARSGGTLTKTRERQALALELALVKYDQGLFEVDAKNAEAEEMHKFVAGMNYPLFTAEYADALEDHGYIYVDRLKAIRAAEFQTLTEKTKMKIGHAQRFARYLKKDSMDKHALVRTGAPGERVWVDGYYEGDDFFQQVD